MSPTAIFSLAVTIVAFWLAQHPPAAFSALGTVGWVAWVMCVALGWALSLLGALVKATISSIDRSLQPTVAMTPVGEDRVDDALGALAKQLTGLGLTRATPPLAVTLSNPAVLLGFVQDGGEVASSAFRIVPPGGRPPVTSFDFVSRFDGDRGGLTTSPNPAGSALRATPGSLRQVFPGAEPAALLQRHREALEWLRAQGVRAKPLRAADFEPLLRLSMERQRAAFLRARLGYALTALWRTVTKSTPYLGPLSQQRGARAEIKRILGAR